MTDKQGSTDLLEVQQKLASNGFDPQCTDTEKVTHLWKLYLESESNLKTAQENVEQLRKQQEEEMKEVENYVEHIRSLSEERMSLTTGLENENEQLKAEIAHLKQEVETHQNEEVREMLVQQGLDEVAQGSVSEQIAYLLVERARLLDELEAEQSKHTSSTAPDNGLNVSQSKLQQLLEQERHDHEEELRQQQESMKLVKEQLKSVHEQELNKVQADKKKIDEQISKARERVKELEKETLKLKGELGKEKLLRAQAEKKSKQGAEAVMLKSGSDEEFMKMKQEKNKLERDMLSMKGKVKILEDQKNHLNSQVKTLTEDLHKERQQTTSKSSSQESSLFDLNSKINTQTAQIAQLQITQQNLEAEKSALTIKLDSTQKDVENLKKKNDELSMENHTLTTSTKETDAKHRKEKDDLRTELKTLRQEISASSLNLNKTNQSKVELEQQLRMKEEMLADQKQQGERIQDTLKSKLRTMELKVESLEDEVSRNQQEVKNTTKNYEKLLSLAKAETTSIQDRLTRELSSKDSVAGELTNKQLTLEQENRELSVKLDIVEKKFRDSTTNADHLTTDRDQLASEKNKLISELQTWKRLQGEAESKTAELSNRVSELEETIKNLEGDNKELAAKLLEAVTQNSEKEILLNEREKQQDAHATEKLQQSVDEISMLNNEIDHLRDELRAKHLHVTRLETEAANDKVKGESGLSLLRSEMSELKMSHQREIQDLGEKLEVAYRETRDLNTQIREKEEEIRELREANDKVQNSGSKVEFRLETEIRSRSELERRNATLEQEMTKVLNQMKELLEKVRLLEESNKFLEEELERKRDVSKQSEMLHSQRTNDHNMQLQMSNNRADNAERRASELNELQGDLEEALTRLQAAEHQLREAPVLRMEIQAGKDELIRLRNNLQEEKLQKQIASQTCEELKQQLNSLKDRESRMQAKNKELQHTLLDVEAKMNSMKDETKSVNDMHHITEQSKQSMADRAVRLQQETETLQLELLSVTEKLTAQLNRNQERKNKHRAKLQNAREIFQREKQRLRDDVQRLEAELLVAQSTLSREGDWKTKTENKYKTVLQEKRELLAQNAENEELARDKGRALQLLEVKLKFVEDENFQLQARIDALVKQKTGLEKTVKEYKTAEARNENQKSIMLSLENGISGRASPLFHVKTAFTNKPLPYSSQNGGNDIASTLLRRTPSPSPCLTSTPLMRSGSPLRSQTDLRSQSPMMSHSALMSSKSPIRSQTDMRSPSPMMSQSPVRSQSHMMSQPQSPLKSHSDMMSQSPTRSQTPLKSHSLEYSNYNGPLLGAGNNDITSLTGSNVRSSEFLHHS